MFLFSVVVSKFSMCSITNIYMYLQTPPIIFTNISLYHSLIRTIYNSMASLYFIIFLRFFWITQNAQWQTVLEQLVGYQLTTGVPHATQNVKSLTTLVDWSLGVGQQKRVFVRGYSTHTHIEPATPKYLNSHKKMALKVDI